MSQFWICRQLQCLRHLTESTKVSRSSPSVTRDLALVVDKSVFVGEIEKVIKKCGGKMLESYKLFDVYEGAQVAPGKKSVAYSLVFRDKTKTLTDADVNPVVEKLLAELSKMGNRDPCIIA